MNVDFKNYDKIRKIADDVNENPETSFRWIKRFLPIGLLCLIVFGAWFYFQYACHKKQNPKSVVAANVSIEAINPEAMNNEGKVATENWTKTLGEKIEVKLPNGTSIQVPQKGFEIPLINYLNEGCPGDIKMTWFNCDRLLFNSASSILNNVSLEQIQTLALIFNAYPKASFKIGGYTDNTGDADFNRRLSADRAAIVMTKLTEYGVGETRLSSEGYGKEHPVCPANDTEECKEKNRRVALRVTTCQ